MSNLLKHSSVNIETCHIIYNNPASNSNANGNKIKKTNTISDAKEEADRIIENAQNYAAKVKSYAERKAEADYEEAKNTGFKVGYEEATELVESKNLAVAHEIENLLVELDANKEQLIDENKQNVIELAFKIAERVINQKLTSDKELFFKIYEKAVKDLVAQKWLKLTISKNEVQLVTSNSDYLLSMVSGAERLEVEVLDDAQKGTCIVETSEKIVDESIITQLDKLRNSVLNS